jgi:2-polyprenyl-3-methyl-5-hydroxy-6-metoxy-1,4-benzoquinol methylase
MQYDPIKQSLGRFFNRLPILRKLFYHLLDWLLLRSWHIRKELRCLKKEGVPVSVIFDAGSGFGQYSYRMAKMFPKARIIGADIKEEQIADCKSFFRKAGMAGQVRFRLSDLTRTIIDNRYNLIISVDVMEHIKEDRKVFENFWKSMKPGGILLISTPSDQGGSDTHDHDHKSGVHGFIDEHVRDGYNILEIEKKLLAAGFRMVEARYSYGWPGEISWKLSMKFPILMLGVSKFFFIILPFYYMAIFPFAIVLNYIDINIKHKTGTGLIVKAVK